MEWFNNLKKKNRCSFSQVAFFLFSTSCTLQYESLSLYVYKETKIKGFAKRFSGLLHLTAKVCIMNYLATGDPYTCL